MVCFPSPQVHWVYWNSGSLFPNDRELWKMDVHRINTGALREYPRVVKYYLEWFQCSRMIHDDFQKVKRNHDCFVMLRVSHLDESASHALPHQEGVRQVHLVYWDPGSLFPNNGESWRIDVHRINPWALREYLRVIKWCEALSSRLRVTAGLPMTPSFCLYSQTPFDPRYLSRMLTNQRILDMCHNHFDDFAYGMLAIFPSSRGLLRPRLAFHKWWRIMRNDVHIINPGALREYLGLIEYHLELFCNALRGSMIIFRNCRESWFSCHVACQPPVGECFAHSPSQRGSSPNVI